MFMYKNIIILILAFLLTACANLPIYQSIAESNFDNETIYSGYDSDSRLRWLISNDTSNLFIRIDTDNPITIKKILNLGMSIYFDTLLKKQEGIALNYPIFETSELSKKDKEKKNNINQNTNERGIKLGLMLQKTASTIKFIKNKEIHIFNTFDKNSEISANIKADNNGNLQYYTKIPFKLISSKNIYNLSIGIDIDGFDIEIKPRKNNNNDNIFDSNNNNRNRGRHSRVETSAERQPELAKDINIWFKVNLTK